MLQFSLQATFLLLTLYIRNSRGTLSHQDRYAGEISEESDKAWAECDRRSHLELVENQDDLVCITATLWSVTFHQDGQRVSHNGTVEYLINPCRVEYYKKYVPNSIYNVEPDEDQIACRCRACKSRLGRWAWCAEIGGEGQPKTPEDCEPVCQNTGQLKFYGWLCERYYHEKYLKELEEVKKEVSEQTKDAALAPRVEKVEDDSNNNNNNNIGTLPTTEGPGMDEDLNNNNNDENNNNNNNQNSNNDNNNNNKNNDNINNNNSNKDDNNNNNTNNNFIAIDPLPTAEELGMDEELYKIALEGDEKRIAREWQFKESFKFRAQCIKFDKTNLLLGAHYCTMFPYRYKGKDYYKFTIAAKCWWEYHNTKRFLAPHPDYKYYDDQTACFCEQCKEKPYWFCEKPGDGGLKEEAECEQLVCQGTGKHKYRQDLCSRWHFPQYLEKLEKLRDEKKEARRK